MSYPVYTVPAGDVLPIMFDTFDGGTGASITMTGLAVTDIEIYKDGGATQRASDAGYTLLDTDGIDFDGITGIHGFSIDTGDNTDAGFYTTGSWFHVVVSSVTVDAQTVNFIAAAFRIVAAESSAGVPKADVSHWLGTAVATPTTAGVPEVDITYVSGSAVASTTAGHIDVDAHYWNGTEITTALETAADIADAVYDEALSGHTTAGTAGERLGRIPNAAAGGNGGLPTVNASNYIAGVQGTLNTLDALDTAQDSQHAATLTRLGTPAGADIAADLATIVADTNELQTDDVPGLIAALNDISTADVNAQVVDVLKTDTIAEMAQGAPTATPTFEEAVMYLYMALRNKVDVDASTKEFHNDAGTVIWKKALTDNGTTYSEAEGVTGP